ncbi:Crp/Fnr family transcriptional regulator [Hansschlegelia plantiphila]|nr:Crp/Fnr family transcriptional regulator [Hansschlegelia plantiphila]
MLDAMLAKLEALQPLPEEDKKLLHAIVGKGRPIKAGDPITLEGEQYKLVHVMLSGHACRYKILADGKRQIIGYLVPGDFCDLFGFLLDRMDHSISALTPCEIVELTEDDVLMLTARPMLARALWWSNLVDSAILREWLVNVGRRTPDKRIAHILCELLVRLQTVGVARSNGFRLALSQADLGDTVGLTTVSVNRALQRLRRSRLIVQTSREITIPDVSALMAFADFDPSYLHFRQDRDEPLQPRQEIA